VNVHEVEAQGDPDDAPGFQPRLARIGPTLGGAKIGMSIYELPPGQAICPYHFELGNEEWLICLAGAPTLRTPEGERPLRRGDVVCFPAGPDGAHLVRNETGETARVALLSTKRTPHVAIYPDSRKLGVWYGDEHHMVRLDPQLDYWDGEA
jgi:uncharacterized cupin superfamily protein